MIQRQLQVNNEPNSSFSNNNNLSQNISHSNQALQNRIDAIKLIINNLKRQLDSLTSEVEILQQYLEVNNYVELNDSKTKENKQ